MQLSHKNTTVGITAGKTVLRITLHLHIKRAEMVQDHSDHNLSGYNL